MGAWSASITGNDTAQDLRDEYMAAFCYYDVPTALEKIDNYVRTEMCDESDEEEWCNYYYSLANYMWKKGILTDEVRDRAVGMIDSGFGLGLWEESDSVLRSRKKALQKFREQLLSPMPEKKKIKPNVNTESVFEDGDLVAIKLQTAGKPYTRSDLKHMTDEEFHALDGKYIIMQKICDQICWRSRIVPDVCDHWAVFRLLEGIYDHLPESVDIDKLIDADIGNKRGNPVFCCESKMFYFKKRDCHVLGNYKKQAEPYLVVKQDNHIFFGINKPWSNPDSDFVSYMFRRVALYETTDFTDELRDLAAHSVIYGSYDYSLPRDENDRIMEEKKQRLSGRIGKVISSGGKLICISYGVVVGLCTVQDNIIDNVYVKGVCRNNGFGTELLTEAKRQAGQNARIRVPFDHSVLKHICNKIGLYYTFDNTGR